MDLQKFKDNQKTSYLATVLEKLIADEHETEALAASDPAMLELAAGELSDIKKQKESIIEQMESILAVEKTEEEFPNEIVVEVRAGAGGDEASLFAEELTHMYERLAEHRAWS